MNKLCNNCKEYKCYFKMCYEGECIDCYNLRMKIRDEENKKLYDERLNKYIEILKNDNDKLLKAIAILCIKFDI